jgi:hypothetical protein
MVPDHLETFVGNVLSDGGDEFLGRENLEVFLVTPMGHGRPVKNLAAILDIGNLLFGEGVSKDIFRQGLLAFPVISGYLISGMNAEAAVMPRH